MTISEAPSKDDQLVATRQPAPPVITERGLLVVTASTLVGIIAAGATWLLMFGLYEPGVDPWPGIGASALIGGTAFGRSIDLIQRIVR